MHQLTSCACPEKYPLKALLDVYWQRWEIERGYGELKQYQLSNKPALRSLKQEGIYQELWGILTSYNIVRLKMAEMAKAHKVEPLRISFINALYLIQDEFLWCSGRSPGTIPKKLKELRENGKRLILPEKRKRKAYPRAVLAKTQKYPVRYKRKKHHSFLNEWCYYLTTAFYYRLWITLFSINHVFKLHTG
ncbi:hypothetical protein BCD66_07590 [Pseudoalteromonas tetraodonis]|nr:hypothetical protein BCD66_07590 [Pseudoalteromonas tetraodonis]